MYKFNLNCYWYISLTEKGEKIYKNNFIKYNIEPPSLNYIEINNKKYIKMQAWQVMEHFGKFIGMGFSNPFDINILMNEEDVQIYTKQISRLRKEK